jgi:hypothetical protein
MDTPMPSGQPPTPQPPTSPNPGANPKITHSKPGLGSPVAPRNAETPMPLAPGTTGGAGTGGAPSAPGANAPSSPAGPAPTVSKITAFGRERKHEDAWQRSPNTTGAGAIHVKTFHCKLTEDALQYMDQLINEWLDAHPQYEVKFVSGSIGVMTGKLKEPALICQVWV